MVCPLHILLAAACCAALLGCIAIPQILAYVHRKRLFDYPDERKIHKVPTPRFGGVAFLPVILLTTLAFSLKHLGWIGAPEAGFMAGCLFIYIMEIQDDLKAIIWKRKFLVQFIAAVTLTSCGVWIRDFGGFLGIHAVPAAFGIPFSILVIILIDNAINLIDGMDGLAASLCIIASLTFALAFRILSSPVHAIAAASTVGVLLPFWYFNVLGTNEKKTKTFMGDTGSQTLGFLLAFFIITLTNHPGGERPDVLLVIGFSTVALPVMDLLRVFGERLASGKQPFEPDARHIHHKPLRLGLSVPQALATLVVLDIVLVVANVFLAGKWDIHVLLAADLLFWMVLNALLSLGLKRSGR